MIELHTTPTTNGYKVSIMLEECGLPYRVRAYDLMQGEHQTPEFLQRNPVGRLPLLIDEAAAGGAVTVYGTHACLLYLAEKTGRFLPADPAARAAVHTWCGVIAGDVGPAYSGQFVFQTLAPEPLPWAREFYAKLCLRMLGALEAQLATHPFLAGAEYTIADMLAYPVAAVSARRHPGSLAAYPALARWADTVGARPAVQRGMRVPS